MKLDFGGMVIGIPSITNNIPISCVVVCFIPVTKMALLDGFTSLWFKIFFSWNIVFIFKMRFNSLTMANNMIWNLSNLHSLDSRSLTYLVGPKLHWEGWNLACYSYQTVNHKSKLMTVSWNLRPCMEMYET